MKGPIVVPLDGSALAEQALPLATAVARRGRLPIHLVTVHEAAAPPSGDGFDASYDPSWYATTQAGQRRYLEAVAERFRTDQFETTVAVPEGRVVPSLLAYVEREGAALVVMVTHGRGGLNRLWIGSTLDRFVREASVPVLVARALAQPETGEPSLERMILPLDGSPLAERVLEPALALGALFDCAYELVRVVLVPYMIGSPYMAHSLRVDEKGLKERLREAESYLAELAERLGGAGRRRVTTRVIEAPGQPVADAVLRAATESSAHIIAVATHGRGGLRRLVLGSVADKLIRAADLPLLVVRPSEAADARG